MTEGLEPNATGIVIINYGLQVLIEGLNGIYCGNHYRCYKRANVPSLVAGDHVIWRNANPFGVVVARQTRSSKLARLDIGGKTKSVAANVSQLFIVIACLPLPITNLIDRYIVAAEAEQISVKLVANKMDLNNHKNSMHLQEVINEYQHIGYPVIRSSMKIPAVFPKFGGMSEFYPDGYEFIFEQYDYADLSSKIIQLYEHKNIKHISKNVFEKAVSLFDEKTMVNKFYDILSK